jgi:hypothetical protein
MTMSHRTTLALSLTLLFGCVTEVRVGMEQLASGLADAGNPGSDAGDGDTLDSGPGECSDVECAEPALAVCPGAECLRNAEGVCEWTGGSCSPDGGELPPCTTFDCEGPLLRKPDFDKTDLTCGDGSAPVCTRDASGVCGYACDESESCGTASAKACGAGKYCMFNLGICASKDDSGGVCRELPSSCDSNVEPVCGCDGTTYGNACEAASKGVNVAFTGECSNQPGLCDESACGSPPGALSMPCADSSEHRSGLSCVATGPEGMCTWQWLECPSEGTCDITAADLAPGRCFEDGDCAGGQKCEGASICPCATQCFSPDVPGYCK